MDRGRIDLTTLDGPFDLQATVESGQSYLWNRADGRDYETETAFGDDCWYWTTAPDSDGDPGVVRVRQDGNKLQWEASFDATAVLRRRLRLDDDLPAIRATAPDDAVVEAAYDAYWGMRLVDDPPFPTLITFICSTQMRVGRIHDMQRALRERYGQPLTVDGERYHAYPTPAALAAATEADLRDLGLGYRAPYVQATAEMVASGDADPAAAAGRPYEAAREYCTRFVGVGPKVADCICLFALGYLEAVPLDTWMQTVVADYYPDCDRDGYAETSRAIRQALGGEYAGYTQTYLFHYLRNGGDPTDDATPIDDTDDATPADDTDDATPADDTDDATPADPADAP